MTHDEAHDGNDADTLAVIREALGATSNDDTVFRLGYVLGKLVYSGWRRELDDLRAGVKPPTVIPHTNPHKHVRNGDTYTHAHATPHEPGDVVLADRAAEAPETPCPHPAEAVYYNPLNGVMQCHRCGHVMDAPPQPDAPEAYVSREWLTRHQKRLDRL